MIPENALSDEFSLVGMQFTVRIAASVSSVFRLP
ncbi:hypothetical protein L327_11475 [Yersinia pestis S3]|nr:hypothetical protein L327_11475 [Yersinia pestis S3]